VEWLLVIAWTDCSKSLEYAVGVPDAKDRADLIEYLKTLMQQ